VNDDVRELLAAVVIGLAFGVMLAWGAGLTAPLF